MNTQQEESGHAGIDDSQVADYLRSHPDFFLHNAALLTELSIPHSAGQAVSLIERQVQVLREQNANLRTKFHALVEVGKENEDLSRQVHALSLELISSRDRSDLFTRLDQLLRKSFSIDAVAIHLKDTGLVRDAGDGIVAMATENPVLEVHDKSFAENHPVCGRLTEQQREHVFAAQADKIKSAALLPLGTGAEYGLLAMGSSDAQRFQGDADTLFLEFIGDLVARLLRNFEAGES